jgi:hypothetical protein
MQKFIIILFYVFAIVGISVFVFAYLQSILAIRKLHMTFSIGLAKSKECGFEYMEKESGITNLYRALNDPLNPLQQLMDSTLKSLLFTIGLFAVCVFIVVLYYFAKQPINATTGVPKPNFFDAWTDKSGWMSIVKLGIYIRYLLIPTVLVVLLFFYFKKSNQLYLPNYNETKEEWMENADPEIEQQKKETLARDIESTTLRQLTVLGGLAARMFVMKLFYVPDIPISSILLGLTDASMIIALTLLILITKFNGEIQAIFRDGYTKQVRTLNENITNLMASPVFQNHYVRNAQRMEKNTSEKFMPHHVHQLSQDGNLHWYLEHHTSSNNELEFMKKESRTRQTGARNKQITWSPVVNRIRADMSKLRQSQYELEEVFNKNLAKLLLVYTLPLFIILYVLFHTSYTKNSLKTVQGVVFAVFLLLVYVILQNFVGTISTSTKSSVPT